MKGQGIIDNGVEIFSVANTILQNTLQNTDCKSTSGKVTGYSQQIKEFKDPLPKELYDVLACPVDKADVVYTKDKSGLQCQKCKYVYPIREGIPIMLPPDLQEERK